MTGQRKPLLLSQFGEPISYVEPQARASHFKPFTEIGLKLLMLQLYMTYFIEWKVAYALNSTSTYTYRVVIANQVIKFSTMFTGDWKQDQYALFSFDEFCNWIMVEVEVKKRMTTVHLGKRTAHQDYLMNQIINLSK